MNCIEYSKPPYQISDKIIILSKPNNNNKSIPITTTTSSSINNINNSIENNNNNMSHYSMEKNNNMSNSNNNKSIIQQQQQQQQQQPSSNENYFNQIKNNPNSGLFFNFKANINNDNYPTVCAHKSICLICNRDIPPCLSSRSVSWVSILRVVFYSLKNLYPEKEYFNLKKDVYGYVATHWSLICTKKKKTPGWRKQLQDALSHCRRLFESGADHHECYGFWKLKDMSDPWEENINNNSNSNNSNNSNNINSNNNNNNNNENNILNSSGNNINNGNGSPFSNPSSPQMVYTSPVLSLSNNSSPNYHHLSQSNSITTTPLLGSIQPPNYLTTSSNNIRTNNNNNNTNNNNSNNNNLSRYSPNHLTNNNGANTPNSLISSQHHSRSLSNSSTSGFNLHNSNGSNGSSSTSSTPLISSGLLSPQNQSSLSNNSQFLNINNYINDLSNLGISSPVLTNSLVSRPRSKSLGNSLFQLDSPTTKPQIINNINQLNGFNNSNSQNENTNDLIMNNQTNNGISLSSSFNNMIQYAKTKRSNSQQYYSTSNLKTLMRPEKLPKLHEDFNSVDYYDSLSNHHNQQSINNIHHNILNHQDHQVVPNDNKNSAKDKVSISNLLNNSTDSFEDSPPNNSKINPNNNNILSNSDIIFKFSRKRSFDLT